MSDKFRNVLWTWSYSPTEDKPTIINLTPVCAGCGSSARTYQDDDSLVLFCSLCDNILDSTVATEAGYREVIRQMIYEVIRNCHGG